LRLGPIGADFTTTYTAAMGRTEPTRCDRAIVLGMGAGQCGLRLLARILDAQPDAKMTHEQPPLLPWELRPGEPGVKQRLERLLANRREPLVGDVATFYLPHAEQAIEAFPEIRIVCLERPREEVVAGFCRLLDETAKVPTSHWAREPGPGWFHDPLWTRIFPQYDTSDRADGIGRYWDEYSARAAELARRFPNNVRVWDADVLTSEAGVREVLEFVGVPRERQVIVKGERTRLPEPVQRREAEARQSPAAKAPPAACVVLVPHTGFIHPECDDALKELERRGYPVRRVGGFSAIDQGRNQLATDALVEGFQETLWIDSDIGFHPDAVEQLRGHALPITCGIYPKKGKPGLACHVGPGTPTVVFGRRGGLVEITYAGAGFLHVRREVYLTIQEKLGLPVCNEGFGRPMIPFFQPLVRQLDEGHWYLAEDFAFCERARQCGYAIRADTTIRLWHIGTYRYGWEDAGIERERFGDFTLHLGPPLTAL